MAAKKSNKSNKSNRYVKHTMKEKFRYHANRAFENRMPKGSHMTPSEKAAYSAGYVKHAQDALAAAKFNAAIAIGYPKEVASEFAKSKGMMIDYRTGNIVEQMRR